jgi:nitrite reductase/ring-hydroxylating ferredoxin subunit
MSTPTAKSPLAAVTEQIEQLEGLDAPAKAIGKTVRDTVKPGTLKDLLSGTWLGHAVHPILTDVVVGSWTSATILDLVGGAGSEDGARKLVGVGIAAYGPTALTGMTDWADGEPADDDVRRTGLVHAATNATALAAYSLSYRARRRGRRGAGTLWGLAGAGVLAFGGYLGGHLAFAQGQGVDQTRFDTGPEDWTPAMDGSRLKDGEPASVVVDETPVMLVRTGGRVRALHDRCSHRGCSLAGAGKVDGDVFECGCHGSRFSLDDGRVQRGPATTRQPAYEVRESGDRIEIRLQS